MIEQDKLSREEVLKELSINEDTLSLYENELEMSTGILTDGLENFTGEDIESIKIIHKLRESGLTYNEIKLLVSFSEVINNTELDEDSLKKLFKLSPIYKLKQSLNLARQELAVLKEKVRELETSLQKEIEINSGSIDSSMLKAELESKQKIITNLDRKLSEALQQKTQAETQLALHKEGKGVQIKGKKAKELYNSLIEKETELSETKKVSEELKQKLEQSEEQSKELKERVELMEDEISEMEIEVEEKYQEQLSSLKEQIESLIDKKQKEWDEFYLKTNDQQRKEILNLQKKHEQEILKLKYKIREQIDEIEELRSFKNPIMKLFKVTSKPSRFSE